MVAGDRTEREFAARAAVLAVAERFTEVATEVVPDAVRSRLEAIVAATDLPGAARARLRAAVEGALGRGVASMRERLADPDVWLSPMTLREEPPSGEHGWDPLVPEWFVRLLRPRRRRPARPGRLDDPGNRIWIALSIVACSLDPVLAELGLAPAPAPGFGGRYRLHPEDLQQLDPSGRLARLWREYREVYGRFADLVGD